MQKKLISFFIPVLICMNLFTFSAFAAAVPTVTVGKVSGETGATVEVPVVLADNTGFSSLGIEIGYDAAALTLTDVSADTGTGANFTKAQSLTANPYNMSWDSAANTAFNGTLVTLTFKIIATQAGTYPVTVDFYKGRNGNYTDGDNVNYDENFAPLGLKYVSGSVTVSTSGGISDSSISVSGISFTVGLTGNVSKGTVYAALYDSLGTLKAIEQYTAAAVIPVAFNKGITGAYVKILWWDENMKPMCAAQTVPLQ